jgi:hypothetical protein
VVPPKIRAPKITRNHTRVRVDNYT